MGLLVLAVLPGMRRHDQGDTDPLRRAPCFHELARKNDLLAQGAEHLDGKGLIGDGKVEARLVAERCADDRLFIQGRDNRSV